MHKKLLYLLIITCFILTLACDKFEDSENNKENTDEKTNTVIFRFTVPPNVGIRVVRAFFGFDGLSDDDHISANQIFIDPPGDNYGVYNFTAFYPSAGYNHTYSDLLLSYGYTVLLDDPLTGPDDFNVTSITGDGSDSPEIIYISDCN